MPKFKPVKKKKDRLPTPKPGLPCLILIFVGMALIMLLLFSVMHSPATGK
jgi:hypothetical protein